MEDPPGLEWRLREHLGLDLTIYLTSIALDVECVERTTVGSSHDQISSIVLVTLKLSRILIEFEMPLLLLFYALLIRCESGEKVFALLDLSVSICVDNLSQVLHQPEVGTHGVC